MRNGGGRDEDAGFKAGEVVGKLVLRVGEAQGALDHAEAGVEVVDHRHEDSFGSGGHDGGAPLKFALMA